MPWIYLSPHFDDVALSCGGLVWQQTQAGEGAQVWTICAGKQPAGPLSPFAATLHARWDTSGLATEQRRAEDLASCQVMGARPRHFTIPDAIYRRDQASGAFPYISNETLFGPLHPSEQALVARLAAQMARRLPQRAEIVCPLTLGNHVDHQLTRAAAEHLGRRLWYYADVPYVAQHGEELLELPKAGWEAVTFPLSAQAVAAWQAAIAAHASQISSFWPSLEKMRAAMAAYAAENGGLRLWRKP